MATLPSASSITDFLKSKGFSPTTGETLPLYGQRTQIYNASGLGSNLGDYRGTAQQNSELLRFLQGAESSAGVNLNPGNLSQMISIARGGGQQAQATPALAQMGGPTAGNAEDPVFQANARALAASRAGTSVVEEQVDTSTGTATEVVDTVTAPKVDQGTLNKLFDPLAGRDVGQEALDSVTGSPTFPFKQMEVEAQKAGVKAKAQSEAQDLISSLASRGLFFSGKKSQGLKEIEAAKLSDLLGIDRSFALMITEGAEKAAQAIAREAQAGSETALKALADMGFTVNPATGEIVPTAAERRFQQTEARQVQAAERQQTQEAQEFAVKHNIQSPFYFIGGIGYRTSDRKPYSTPQEMFADMGVASFEEARQRGLVTDVDPGAVGVKTSLTSIGGRRVLLTYDDKGNVINNTDLGSSTSGSTGSTLFKPNTAIAITKTNADGSVGFDYFSTDISGITRPISNDEYKQIKEAGKTTTTSDFEALLEAIRAGVPVVE